MSRQDLLIILVMCILVLTSVQSLPAQDDPGPDSVPDPIDLSPDRFEEYRERIRPSGRELKFMDVGWRPTLWQARREAQKRKKPLLLWVMNGHPLGHT